MKHVVTVSTPLEDTYRSNRVRSLFNVSKEQAEGVTITADVPIEGFDWKIGAVIGPSGSGKTTLGRRILGEAAYHKGFEWSEKRPIIEDIATKANFDDVTGALSAVGLGTVPTWLRPFHVISNGEKFRAELARILLEIEGDVVVDEFTSVVDRQIAQIGAAAFAKAWRRKPSGRVVVLSCHYDIIDWLQPDWVLDTREYMYQRRSLQRPPTIAFDVLATNWSPWPIFEKHHYLRLPHMVASYNYIAQIGETPIAHVAVATNSGHKSARMCRLVVMPEYQGAGVGMKFLNCVAELWYRGQNHYKKRFTSIIHTSHPGLIGALNRDSKWVFINSQMASGNMQKNWASLEKWAKQTKKSSTGKFGGHDRAVTAFRYIGDRT